MTLTLVGCLGSLRGYQLRKPDLSQYLPERVWGVQRTQSYSEAALPIPTSHHLKTRKYFWINKRWNLSFQIGKRSRNIQRQSSVVYRLREYGVKLYCPYFRLHVRPKAAAIMPKMAGAAFGGQAINL